MIEYKRELESVVLKTEIKVQETFDYDLSPYRDEFNKTFIFCREALTRSTKYGINESFVLFYNKHSVNAKAGLSNGFGVIMFNSGLQIWTIKNFNENEGIHSTLASRFSTEVTYLDNAINKLMYQLTMHFTFYHELAHLVQKSKPLESFLNERPIKTSQFDLTRHKLEIDADTFSALYMAGHIQQYVLKHFGDELTSLNMESILEMFCSSVLLYILSFQDTDMMYYYESSHPHPVIRLLNVILTMTNYLQQSPRLKEKKVKIDHIKVFKTSIQVASSIEHLIFELPRAKKFEKTVNEEMVNISEYISRLREFKPTNFKLAVDAWNTSI